MSLSFSSPPLLALYYILCPIYSTRSLSSTKAAAFYSSTLKISIGGGAAAANKCVYTTVDYEACVVRAVVVCVCVCLWRFSLPQSLRCYLRSVRRASQPASQSASALLRVQWTHSRRSQAPSSAGSSPLCPRASPLSARQLGRPARAQFVAALTGELVCERVCGGRLQCVARSLGRARQ